MTGAATGTGAGENMPKRRIPLLRPTGRTRTAVFLCVNLLAYALALMILAGSTGVWWTIVLPLPHLLAWAWLTVCSDLGTMEQRRVT